MYQSYFQFDARPFPAPPQADFYVPIGSWEETLRTVARVVERAEGPALVVGGVGTGKSLLCHLLAAHYRKVFQVVMLSSSRLCSARALLQNLLFELQLPYRGLSEGELRFSLMEALEPTPENGNGMLLIVDEAQGLSRRLLEEIRMLTNLVRRGESRVRLVLAGSTRLEEQFTHPRMESFNQRLACRCYLETLTSEETAYYIQTQLHSVMSGEAIDIFDEQAITAIHRLTDGIPRLINQLCDQALLAAALAETTLIDQYAVEVAWADLQQLPPPVSPEEPIASDTNVIEFGQLDDVASEGTPSSAERPVGQPSVVEVGFLDSPPAEIGGETSRAEHLSGEELVHQDLGAVESTAESVDESRDGESIAILPLETDRFESSEDSDLGCELLPLVDPSSPDQQTTGTEWIVSADFNSESTTTSSQEDRDRLIIRRDEQHSLGPDHQPISADALERQRQLLDRLRQP